jgi:rhomboid protease GluP
MSTDSIRCPNCHARLHINEQTGKQTCYLCEYTSEPLLMESNSEIYENPQVVLQKKIAENHKKNTFIQALNKATPNTHVTKAIIYINIAVFALMALKGVNLMSPNSDDIVLWGGNYSATADGEWWRLFTCMFVHIGIIHIFFNMMVLWSLGLFVEKIFGSVLFTLIYIVTGLGGSLASLIWNPYTVSAGASGAVFGIFGALCGFLLIRSRSIPKGLLGELQHNTFVFLGLNLAIGFTIPNIDMAAHLGGLGVGVISGMIGSHPFTEKGLKSRWVRGVLILILSTVGIYFATIKTKENHKAFDNVLTKLQSIVTVYPNVSVQDYHRMVLDEISEEELIQKYQKYLDEANKAQQEFFNYIPENKTSAHVKSLIEYLNLYKQYWALTIEANQTKDEDKRKLSFKKIEEAKELLKKLNEK